MTIISRPAKATVSKMFNTIIFDLDGTICHHKASYPKMFHEIFGEQLNKHSNTWLRHMKTNGEHTGLEAIQACFPHLSEEDQKQALDEFTSRWASVQMPFDGIFRAMSLLRSHYGCQIGVMTNGPSSFQRAVIDKLKLTDYVDFAHASGDPFPAECKPSISLLRKLESKHGFSPEKAIFIGDNLEKDVAPARAAGWKALHVAPHNNPAKPLPLTTFEKATDSTESLSINWSTLTA